VKYYNIQLHLECREGRGGEGNENLETAIRSGVCARPKTSVEFNPLNAKLNPICHLLALLGAHHILHVSRVRVKGHFNPLNVELNHICHLLALLVAHHILHVSSVRVKGDFNPLNAKLNPIFHFLALLVAHHILHVSRVRVKCRIKSHLSFSGIIRSSPYSPR